MQVTSWLIVDTSGSMRIVKNEPSTIKQSEYAFEPENVFGGEPLIEPTESPVEASA